MDADSSFELGWGFWLIIFPLLANILIEAVVKPMIDKYGANLREIRSKQIKALLKWVRRS